MHDAARFFLVPAREVSSEGARSHPPPPRKAKASRSQAAEPRGVPPAWLWQLAEGMPPLPEQQRRASPLAAAPPAAALRRPLPRPAQRPKGHA